jgi:hypothetical protein
VANAVFYLPKLDGSQQFVKQTLGNWELGTIFTAESGNSVDIFVGGSLTDGFNNASIGNPSGLGGISNNQFRLMQTSSCNSGAGKASNGDPRFFNPGAFTLVGYQFGTVGNTPRGTCLGPKRVSGDLSLYKNWKVTEKLGIQFRLEGYNIFNHANFRNDSINTSWLADNKVFCGSAACSPANDVVTAMDPGSVPKSNFGTPTQTYGGREIQHATEVYLLASAVLTTSSAGLDELRSRRLLFSSAGDPLSCVC